MADQTVRIEKDDVAATAERLARSLWVQETGKSPKASENAFLQLVAVCVIALKGGNPSHVATLHAAIDLPK